MDLMKLFHPVTSFLFVQLTSLLVPMECIANLNHMYVMETMIVMMVLMNMSPSALLHVQVICLLVLMV